MVKPKSLFPVTHRPWCKRTEWMMMDRILKLTLDVTNSISMLILVIKLIHMSMNCGGLIKCEV